VFIYLGNIIISSALEEDLVFKRLVDKCPFIVLEVKILSYSVTAAGAVLLIKHVQIIQEFQRPLEPKQLQHCLGLVNFYLHLIAGAAGIFKLLSDAFRGDKQTCVVWTPVMICGQAVVCSATQLDHPPDPNVDINLVVDASDTRIGAVLHRKWRHCFLQQEVVAYRVKTLST
jgi:hypothetical protein